MGVTLVPGSESSSASIFDVTALFEGKVVIRWAETRPRCALTPALHRCIVEVDVSHAVAGCFLRNPFGLEKELGKRGEFLVCHGWRRINHNTPLLSVQ